MNRLHLGTLAATLAIAGCSLIPTYERPAAPVAATFPTDSAGAGAPQGAADMEWQTFFPDARLKRLVEIALQNNRDLRMAVLAVEQTRAQLQLRRADELPSLNAGLNLTRGPNTSGAIASTYTAGLSITAYELDIFGRVRALSQSAQAQLLASDEARKTVQISLLASVANTYLNLLADGELLRVTRDTLATRRDSLKLTQLKFDNEAASKLDLSQAQSLFEGARIALAQVTRQRAQDENALVLLLGQPLPSDLPSGLGLQEQNLLPSLPAGVPSDLLMRRPDVRQAEQVLLANNANIGAARAAFFPRITLTGSAGVVSSDLENLFSNGPRPGPLCRNCCSRFLMGDAIKPIWTAPKSVVILRSPSMRRQFKMVSRKSRMPWLDTPRWLSNCVHKRRNLTLKRHACSLSSCALSTVLPVGSIYSTHNVPCSLCNWLRYKLKRCRIRTW